MQDSKNKRTKKAGLNLKEQEDLGQDLLILIKQKEKNG